jgi:glucose-1-phosphate thymidylyltransferase
MKGIILAGGSGTRLYPLTLKLNKHLLPLYDKPMIYYPLSVLMIAGIRDILIITRPEDFDDYQAIFGDGSRLGLNIQYEAQAKPGGLAEGLTIGREFANGEPVCMILGDNIFYGHDLGNILKEAMANLKGATVFGYYVRDPERYGVVDFDDEWRVKSIVEKPEHPASNYAVTGLYLYDGNAADIAASVKPSARGELEITDVNNIYHKRGTLNVQLIGRGFVWLDAGTHDSLLEATQFISIFEKRQGLKIACLEEIAWREGYIDFEQFEKQAKTMLKGEYGEYLNKLVDEEKRKAVQLSE